MQTLALAPDIGHDECKERIHQRKERPEIELGEQQRRIRIKSQYVLKKCQLSIVNYQLSISIIHFATAFPALRAPARVK